VDLPKCLLNLITLAVNFPMADNWASRTVLVVILTVKLQCQVLPRHLMLEVEHRRPFYNIADLANFAV